MKNFIFGIVVGIIASTIGFSSMAPVLDTGVQFIQQLATQTQDNNSK